MHLDFGTTVYVCIIHVCVKQILLSNNDMLRTCVRDVFVSSLRKLTDNRTMLYIFNRAWAYLTQLYVKRIFCSLNQNKILLLRIADGPQEKS
jgi:hypothetical protein